MKCKCLSSYIPLAYVWAVLSVLAAIMCPFGLYFSNWLERNNRDGGGGWDSLSSFRYCENETSRISTGCSSYLMFDQIYSDEWKATTLLLGIGACFLVLVALTAIFGFCIVKLFNKAVVVLTFCFQLIGVVLFLIGLILFPAGWGHQNVRTLCDNTGAFQLGSCQLGWAYIVMIVGTVIAAVATPLSWSTIKWREKDQDSHSFAV